MKTDQLEVRKYLLDRLAFFKAIYCFKLGCGLAQLVGMTLGLMLGTDEILKAGDIEPVFAPLFGGILKSVLPSVSLQLVCLTPIFHL
jgi:hypothetical protein